MNNYPPDYIVHNLPLVLLSGLESNSTAETPGSERGQAYLGEGGFRIRAELPALHHPLTAHLRSALLAHNRSDAPWRATFPEKGEPTHAFRVRSVGRTYTLPPRKAPPPPHAPRFGPSNDGVVAPPPLTLHSTLSPLSPSSPLYPDGIISPLWITKHQNRLPSVFVSFYNLVADPNTSSLEDNKIKTEINSIRNLITSTNYKTKFVIVLMADGPVNHTDLEERLVNIRRGTSFDSKALYYLPHASSKTETNEFAKVLFGQLYPTCIEYYRDLSKHARRKRNRNTIPQPTIPPQGTSAVLSLQGWSVRFEFKLAVFAEFRQELDAASRSYETAYEGLFSAELLETISISSIRFNEARMLADVLIIRMIRCLFWTNQTAAGVRYWIKHKDRMRDLIDRRGRGTDNYSWEAWLSTWTRAMIELMERCEVFLLARSRLPSGSTQLLQLKSNAMSVERQPPWEQLHHEGYWHQQVCEHLGSRRSLARKLLEEASESSGTGPTLSTTGQQYDPYLAPKPADEFKLLNDKLGINYRSMIVDETIKAIKSFQARDQRRMVESLYRLHGFEASQAGAFPEALSLLKPLWQQSLWRSQGWWALLRYVGDVLLKVARELKDHELCLQVVWELALLDSTHNMPAFIEPPTMISTAIDYHACLSQRNCTVAFAAEAGHVGEPIPLQLVLESHDKASLLGLDVVEVKIEFDGGISPIFLSSNASREAADGNGQTLAQTIDLSESDTNSATTKRLSMTGASHWSAQTNLRLADVRRRVLNMSVVPREAGPASVASLTVLLRDELHELTLKSTDISATNALWWETRNGKHVSRSFGMRRDVTTVAVLPKPPKVMIKLPRLLKSYYTNETVELDVEVANEEEEMISAELQARLLSPTKGQLRVRWKHSERPATTSDGDIKETTLPGVEMRNLAARSFTSYTIVITNLLESVNHELELNVRYSLGSDSAYALTARTTVDLPIVRPFEANAAFMPRIHPETWPDFFASATAAGADQSHGLKQHYLVRTDIACFAQEELIIRSLNLRSQHIVGGVACTASQGRLTELSSHLDSIRPEKGIALLSEKAQQFYHDLDLQKFILGDRTPAALDFALDVEWSRPDSNHANTSTLLLPKFMAPMSEPRVLLQMSKIPNQRGMLMLSYVIENPSMHFLTFNLTMDSGEGFAFSGSKSKSISLVPLSRYKADYRIYTQKSKEWLRVQLDVLDVFFGQILKVQPASSGVKIDKQGNLLVWVED